MDDKKKLSLWERYLTKEIAIEFKACLYFFALLFFYCVYRVICGIYEAGILHMAEMIFSCYFIGYIQVYLFDNFDESDELKGRKLAGMIICTGIYALLSFVLGWFDGIWQVTAIFVLYWIITYFCVFLIYRSKRRIDDKKLNEELKLFQAGHHKKVQDKDE
ncbi:MAG: DUF3021 domain-containing protein [Lachnospiraceae bacterium]|nr:DUF3021 domain-containing protein [Lachnospiraceae bacterium]